MKGNTTATFLCFLQL